MLEHASAMKEISGQAQAKIFYDIGRVLTSSLNPKDVFSRVMNLIGEYFSPRNWSLLLMEENSGRLKFEIVMGVDVAKLDNVYIEAGEGIAGWVCQSGKPAVVTDVKKDPRFSDRLDQILGFTTRSIVCVPLVNQNSRVIGVIELINKIAPPLEGAEPGAPPVYSGEGDLPFSEMDVEILSAIGVFTGIAAENAFLHQKVKDLARVDSLTGIYNRHYFNEVLKREQKRVKRYSYSICILMMDIDGLKEINDRYGHLTGDRVICDISGMLKSSIRESDVLARYGGDEFIILMPKADTEDGNHLAGRITRKIEEWNEKTPESEPRLGLSVGAYASGSEDLTDILREADRELYLSKYFRKRHTEIVSEEQIRSYLWHHIIEGGGD
jgi:diguanylate cyclase (GGDEF)-like protein